MKISLCRWRTLKKPLQETHRPTGRLLEETCTFDNGLFLRIFLQKFLAWIECICSGGSTLEQGLQLHPQFLALHPQFGTMQHKMSPRIISRRCVDQNAWEWEICLHCNWQNFHVWKFHKLMGTPNRNVQPRRLRGLVFAALHPQFWTARSYENSLQFCIKFWRTTFLVQVFFQGVSRVLGLGSIGNVKGKSRLLGIALLSSDSVTMSKTFIGGDVCRRVRKLRRQKKC